MPATVPECHAVIQSLALEIGQLRVQVASGACHRRVRLLGNSISDAAASILGPSHCRKMT